jgi:hypothetical protein
LATTGASSSSRFLLVTPFIPVQGPDENTPHRVAPAHSIDPVFREFKKDDEVRLVSVVRETRLIEYHWTQEGKREHGLKYVQAPLRCGGWGEMDSFYLGEWPCVSRKEERFMVVVEAKKTGCDLFLSQIFHHAAAAFHVAEDTGICDPETTRVVCLGIQAVGPSQIYLVQYEPVARKQLDIHEIGAMKIESRALYTLDPMVCGIGGYAMPKKKSKTKRDKRQKGLFEARD